jgi:hypothetical protein
MFSAALTKIALLIRQNDGFAAAAAAAAAAAQLVILHLLTLRPISVQANHQLQRPNEHQTAHCGTVTHSSRQTCLMPHVTHHTSHGTRHTAHVTRHTSHVTRHTSHVKHAGSTFVTPRQQHGHAIPLLQHTIVPAAQDVTCTSHAPRWVRQRVVLGLVGGR